MACEKSFARSLESLESLYDFTERALEAGGVADPARSPIHLVTEELFVNMVNYSPASAGDIWLEIRTATDVVTVTITEFGVDPFDVTQPRNVDTDASLDEREPGGLGLHLVQSMVDSLEYEHGDGRSRVVFTKKTGTKDV